MPEVKKNVYIVEGHNGRKYRVESSVPLDTYTVQQAVATKHPDALGKQGFWKDVGYDLQAAYLDNMDKLKRFGVDVNVKNTAVGLGALGDIAGAYMRNSTRAKNVDIPTTVANIKKQSDLQQGKNLAEAVAEHKKYLSDVSNANSNRAPVELNKALNSPKDFLNQAGNLTRAGVSIVPQMAGTTAASALGAIAGGLAGNAPGAVAGGLAAGTLYNTPLNYADQVTQRANYAQSNNLDTAKYLGDTDKVSRLVALAQSAVDAVPFGGGVTGNVIKKTAAGGIEKLIAKQAGESAVKHIAKEALGEGVTGATQELASIAGEKYLGENKDAYLSQQNLGRVGMAGLAEATAGGVMSGGLHLAGHAPSVAKQAFNSLIDKSGNILAPETVTPLNLTSSSNHGVYNQEDNLRAGSKEEAIYTQNEALKEAHGLVQTDPLMQAHVDPKALSNEFIYLQNNAIAKRNAQYDQLVAQGIAPKTALETVREVGEPLPDLKQLAVSKLPKQEVATPQTAPFNPYDTPDKVALAAGDTLFARKEYTPVVGRRVDEVFNNKNNQAAWAQHGLQPTAEDIGLVKRIVANNPKLHIPTVVDDVLRGAINIASDNGVERTKNPDVPRMNQLALHEGALEGFTEQKNNPRVAAAAARYRAIQNIIKPALSEAGILSGNENANNSIMRTIAREYDKNNGRNKDSDGNVLPRKSLQEIVKEKVDAKTFPAVGDVPFGSLENLLRREGVSNLYTTNVDLTSTLARINPEALAFQTENFNKKVKDAQAQKAQTAPVVETPVESPVQAEAPVETTPVSEPVSEPVQLKPQELDFDPHKADTTSFSNIQKLLQEDGGSYFLIGKDGEAIRLPYPPTPELQAAHGAVSVNGPMDPNTGLKNIEFTHPENFTMDQQKKYSKFVSAAKKLGYKTNTTVLTGDQPVAGENVLKANKIAETEQVNLRDKVAETLTEELGRKQKPLKTRQETIAEAVANKDAPERVKSPISSINKMDASTEGQAANRQDAPIKILGDINAPTESKVQALKDLFKNTTGTVERFFTKHGISKQSFHAISDAFRSKDAATKAEGIVSQPISEQVDRTITRIKNIANTWKHDMDKQIAVYAPVTQKMKNVFNSDTKKVVLSKFIHAQRSAKFNITKAPINGDIKAWYASDDIYSNLEDMIGNITKELEIQKEFMANVQDPTALHAAANFIVSLEKELSRFTQALSKRGAIVGDIKRRWEAVGKVHPEAHDIILRAYNSEAGKVAVVMGKILQQSRKSGADLNGASTIAHLYNTFGKINKATDKDAHYKRFWGAYLDRVKEAAANNQEDLIQSINEKGQDGIDVFFADLSNFSEELRNFGRTDEEKNALYIFEPRDYLPLLRDGKYFLVYDGESGRAREHFKTIAERTRRMQQLAEKQGLASEDMETGETDTPDAWEGRVDTLTEVAKTVSGLVEKHASSQDIKQKINTMRIESLGGSYAQRALRAELVPGETLDFPEAYERHNRGFSSYIARLTHSLELENAFKTLGTYAKELRGNDRALAETAIARLKDGYNYQFNESKSNIATTVSSTIGVVQLLSSLGSALSQTFSSFQTLSWLMANNPNVDTAKIWAKHLVNMPVGHNAYFNGLNKDQKAAFRYFDSQGLFATHATMVHDSIGTDNTSKVDKALGLAIDVAKGPLEKMEATTKRSMLMASYDTARAMGKDHNESLDFAADTISRTIGDFSASDRPDWARAKADNALTAIPHAYWMFKQFSANVLAQFAHDVGVALKIKKGYTPQERAVAAKYLVNSGLTGLALLGSKSAIGKGAFLIANLMLRAMLGDDNKEEEQKYGIAAAYDAEMRFNQFLSNVFGEGTFVNNLLKDGSLSAITGLDFTRVGLGSVGGTFIPQELEPSKVQQNGFDKLMDGVVAMMPVTGAIRNIFSAAEALSYGDEEKALSKVLPAGIAAPVKAHILATRGLTDFNGNVLIPPEEFKAIQLFGKALGYEIQDIKNLREFNNKQTKADVKKTQERTLLINIFRNAYNRGDRQKMQATYKKMQEWNESQWVPKFYIDEKDLSDAITRSSKSAQQKLTSGSTTKGSEQYLNGREDVQ